MVTPASQTTGQRGHSEQRTTSKTGIRNHPTNVLRSSCVEIKASQVLQLGIAESYFRTFDKATLGRWCRVFTPRYFDRLQDGSSF
jgi:hypothetical protein